MDYKYTSKTNTEIEDLARAVEEKRVFGSWMMQPHEDPSIVFMPLAFLTDRQLGQMKAQGVLHIYEFTAHGSKRKTPEGYPTFPKARFLSAIDCKRLEEKIAERKTDV